MRVRSTGLGTTMMVARVGNISRLENSLLMVMESSEPVKWKIRIALTYKDVLIILKLGFWTILKFLIADIKTIFKEPPAPKTF